MAGTVDFSKQLRSLGQQMDTLGMESFSVRVEPDGFAVTGQGQYQPPSEKSLWQRLRHASKPAAPAPPVELHLSFSADDLARVDAEAAEGRDKRSKPPDRMEAHSTSQILRAVGAFIEERQGQLLVFTRDGQQLTLEYESVSKIHTVQHFTVSSLYDYCVAMYLDRSEHSRHSGETPR